MENLSQVLEKIRSLRVQKGISQTQMAISLGITQAGYANIESNNKGKLSLAFAVGIAKVLGVGFNELYNIEGDSQKIEILNQEIETLKNRIKDLEEQLIEKKQIVDLLIDAGLIITTARELRHREDGIIRIKNDFDDLDSLIKDLEEQEAFDKNALEYVQNYIKKLKGS